jgi:hypothetical protein
MGQLLRARRIRRNFIISYKAVMWVRGAIRIHPKVGVVEVVEAKHSDPDKSWRGSMRERYLLWVSEKNEDRN